MRRLFGLILILLLALLLFGCGGGSKKLPQTAGGSVHPPGWGAPAPPSARLTIIPPSESAVMFDTITLSTVPSNPFALAGYTSGFWPTFLPLRRSYPSAHTISIAISAAHYADCLDVEPGDAAPWQAPGWVRSEMRAGWHRPCVYSSYSMFVTQVRPALQRAGISRGQVWEWDADYTYTPHIDTGFDGTQWTDRSRGRNLDESLVLRSFLSIAHPPYKPAPHPKPKPTRRQQEQLEKLLAYRNRLRHTLNVQHCRVKHPNRHCRGVLRTGQIVNKQIRALEAQGVHVH